MSIEKAGELGALEAAIERKVEQAGRRGLSVAQIADLATEAGFEGAYQPLLRRLAADGTIVEWNRRWYALASTDWVVGRLQALDGGDALLRSGAGGEAGYFVPRRYRNGARDGDRVVTKPLGGPQRRGRRRSGAPSSRGRLPEASVVRVLRRAFDSLVGTIERRDGRAFLQPFDPRLRAEVEVVGDVPGPDHYVEVEIDHDGSPHHGPLRSKVSRVLGTLDTAGVDTEVVERHFGLTAAFPPEVEQSAGSLPEDPDPADWKGRRDHRDRVVVTIDGATARDFDDAIHVEKTDRGYALTVYIADVSHYVTPGSALDLEAYRRGTSVYFADKVLPMLPEALSNGLCSLRPDVPRLVQATTLTFDRDAKVVRSEFFDAVIESRRRLTYLEVAALLDDAYRERRSEYGEVWPMLEVASELAERLMRARAERGSIDFDLPAGSIELDDEGAPVAVAATERTFAHRLIEEFMLAANEAVARELAGRGEGALYRVHDAPSLERLVELREILQTLGHELPARLEGLHPSALQEALAAFAGKPEEPFVSALVLRSMQRARYSEENLGHYALAERHYTHFTSPIRRYPDLVVHRKLRHGASGADDREETARLEAIAGHCSEMERRAERAERELRRWRLVRLVAEQVGELAWGRITGVEPFGLFVELEESFVDGLMAVRDMESDFFEYEPAEHRLVGRRSGQSYRLGDRVQVRIVAVDTLRRRIDLGLPGDDDGRSGSGDRRGRERRQPGRQSGRQSGRQAGRGRGRRRR